MSHAFAVFVFRIIINVPGPHICGDLVGCLLVAKYVSGPHVFCDVGVYGSYERGIDGSRSSIELTVVCIESIPAYAGVVVRGCLPWCMSGSLAGQLNSQN